MEIKLLTVTRTECQGIASSSKPCEDFTGSLVQVYKHICQRTHGIA